MKPLFWIAIVGLLLGAGSSTGLEVTNPIPLLEFGPREVGGASVNSIDGTLLCSVSGQRVFWYQNGSITKEIQNATQSSFSPDGRLYSFIRNKVLYVCDSQDRLINKFVFDGFLESYAWTWDSRCILICIEQSEYAILRLEVATGECSTVLKSKTFFHPIPVKNSEVLYLLDRRDPDDCELDCDIVTFNLQTGQSEKVRLPEGDFWIFDSFAVSPDGKYALVTGEDARLYLIDIRTPSVVSRIDIRCQYVDSFSWSVDGSYVIFNPDGRKIVKYVLP